MVYGQQKLRVSLAFQPRWLALDTQLVLGWQATLAGVTAEVMPILSAKMGKQGWHDRMEVQGNSFS